MAALLEAILLPDKIAICKCAAHTTNKDFVSTGNARADTAAKAAVAKQIKDTECTMLSETNPDISSSLQSMQVFASVAERDQWKKFGCKMTDGVWMSCDGKPCLPRHFFPHYTKSMHGKDHALKGRMVTQMKELWFTKGFTTFAENICKRCLICNTHNGKGKPEPFEILFGKPPFMGIDGGKQQRPSTELCEHDMLSYCK